MKKIIDKFHKLNTIQKIEFVLALLFSVMLVIGFSVYAWFSHTNNIETMTKIKEPDNLDIRAGNFDQIVNFDLSDIDIEEMAKTSKSQYYVFSVSAGDYKIKYDIQLAHTTNIPFKYTLWKATQVESDGTDVVQYHPLDDDTTITYYKKGEEIVLEDLNADNDSDSYFGRTLAETSETYYNKTYNHNDEPEIYSVPVYSKTQSPIDPQNKGSDQHDYFILELKWDNELAATSFSKWNKAENNKETDIIYITVSRSTS
ncbi:MAG: hypothetical protein PUG48_07345 [Clostridia bacterium]|nr:hypothetical protein [Clostridia bacterium]